MQNKAKELRSKTTAQLQEELATLLKTHFSLRMKRALQQEIKTSDLCAVRRNIARVRTIMQQKGDA